MKNKISVFSLLFFFIYAVRTRLDTDFKNPCNFKFCPCAFTDSFTIQGGSA